MTIPLFDGQDQVLPLAPPAAAAAELTVLQVVNLYMAHLKRRTDQGDFSAHAYEDMERELRRFAGVYGARGMSQCRKYDLTEWMDSNTQWTSNHTRKRVLASIIRPFLWAEDQELIGKSPYHKPKDLRLPTEPRRAAEEGEYVLLMRQGSRPLRRALFFLRRTGARTCEMREIVWSEVDFERGVIQKIRHKTRGQQRDPKPRLIGLDPALIRFLRNLHRQRPVGQECVFLNSRKTPWDRHTFARHLRRYADRAGIDTDLSAYCVRHMWGTAAVETGLTDKAIADQLGHTTTRLVSWYGQTAGKADHLRKVAGQAARRRLD